MTNQEVLDNLAIAQAQVEWEYNMDIAASLDVAMKRVKNWEQLKEDIAWTKKIMSDDLNRDYATGFICALSNIEGRMAEMENEDDKA